jgi:restriction system protein
VHFQTAIFLHFHATVNKRQGHKIKRNKRYSHDGGIDGEVIIKNKQYLIQAKRYTNHINPKHVQDFIKICRKRRKKGLFIHTGITGKKSKSLAQNSNIEIINGERLTNMLTNQHR